MKANPWVFWNKRGIRIGESIRGPLGMRFSLSKFLKW